MKWMWSVAVASAIVVVSAAPVRAQVVSDEPVVSHRVVDARAGAVLRVFEAPAGSSWFEVADERVRVRKHIAKGRAVTEIQTPAETLEIALAPGVVRLAGTNGELVVRRRDAEASRVARERLRASHAVTEAIALLGRLTPARTSPVVLSLLSSRVVLGALRGDESVRRLAMTPRPEAPRTVRVLDRQDPSPDIGPGECWDTYAEEAIETYMEYEDCVDNTDWYDLGGLGACLVIYELRAGGAFSWWLSCVAIRS